MLREDAALFVTAHQNEHVFAPAGSKLCLFETCAPPPPGHILLRPLSPMEPPIHDVHFLLKKDYTRNSRRWELSQRRLFTHYALAGPWGLLRE